MPLTPSHPILEHHTGKLPTLAQADTIPKEEAGTLTSR